jgi:hypothetical protein
MKNMDKKNKKDERQTTVEDFLSEFTVDAPRSDRDVWVPTRDEIHVVTITASVDVTNDFGTSVMNTVEIDGEVLVWFCKGYENYDMRKFMEGRNLPLTVRFVRTQNQSSKNADRMVNRLFIREE